MIFKLTVSHGLIGFIVGRFPGCMENPESVALSPGPPDLDLHIGFNRITYFHYLRPQNKLLLLFYMSH